MCCSAQQLQDLGESLSYSLFEDDCYDNQCQGSYLNSEQRPLKTIAIKSGDVYIPCGVSVPALDKDILWEFQPKKLGTHRKFNFFF
nr:V-type proton ATPase catalytic subunit A [Ipomoea batatas]